MSPISRRHFIGSSAATLALAAGARSAWAGPATRPAIGWRGANRSQLNIGMIGVGNRGFDHVRDVLNIAQANVIAICDVDQNYLDNAAGLFPSATKYVDFRELIEHPSLEAVVIATPDHTHAVACAAALKKKLHVYCEKPLTYTVHEARTLIDLAKKQNVVTQVGMQIHAMDNYRRVVEIIQSGAIGHVRDVHIWIERVWPDVDMNVTQPPPHINYDLWLGPVEPQPYHPQYHPVWWRRFSRFSNGILGDMACHYMDVAYWALGLRHPNRIEVKAATNRPPEVCPDWRVALYDYPARSSMPPLRLYWYDGGKLPIEHSIWKIEKGGNEGVMFVGDDGMLFTNYWEHHLYPQEKFKDFKPPPQRIAKSPGHLREWVEASLKCDPTAASCPFDYGGTVTEAPLLGNVALRAGKTIEWDAAKMKIPNAPEAERYLETEYRAGWTL